MAKRSYNLTIQGIKITVESELDDLTINAIERNVNQKMQEISSNTAIPGTSQAAILAALEIESEKFSIETDYKTSMNAVDKKLDDLISLIDGALE